MNTAWADGIIGSNSEDTSKIVSMGTNVSYGFATSLYSGQQLQYIASAGDSVDKFYIYCGGNGPASAVCFAIYDVNTLSRLPVNRIAYSETISIGNVPAITWYDAVPSGGNKIGLTEGTIYTIVAIPVGATIRAPFISSSPTNVLSYNNVSPLPNPWVSSGYFKYTTSMYASYTSGGAPPTPPSSARRRRILEGR